MEGLERLLEASKKEVWSWRLEACPSFISDFLAARLSFRLHMSYIDRFGPVQTEILSQHSTRNISKIVSWKGSV